MRKAKDNKYPITRATVWINEEFMKQTQVEGINAVIEYPYVQISLVRD